MAGEVHPSGQPVRRGLTRRALLLRVCGGGLGGLTGAAGAGAYVHDIEPFWATVERHEMDFPQLDPALVGLRLAQLSDLHLFYNTGSEYLGAQIERCMTLSPDVVVLTGDFITRADGSYTGQLTSLLSKLRAPLGVFAVLGNHDWAVFQRGRQPGSPMVADRLERALNQTGIRVLRNERHVLAAGGARLQLVGLDELWSGHCDPEAAFRDADPTLPTVVLVHNPDAIDLLADRPGDWVLCGHTHGGQVRLPFYGAVVLPTEHHYDAGRFQVAGRRLYVNRGLGFVCQVRFNCRPEITLFTLARRA
jgi:predicted MPP superfamily phosphohydrolase